MGKAKQSNDCREMAVWATNKNQRASSSLLTRMLLCLQPPATAWRFPMLKKRPKSISAEGGLQLQVGHVPLFMCQWYGGSQVGRLQQTSSAIRGQRP
ncbi:hypothetical protein VTN96DRAFT_7736 [Rasamsonia emersonii]